MVIFLDEFRIMASTRYAGADATVLTVFNTLIPQYLPGGSRRLGLPRQYHNGRVILHVDQDRSLGRLDMDGPLIPDPSQAIFVMQFLGPRSRSVLQIVQTEALIDLVCSTCANDHVPWDEWGRGAAFIEIPIPGYTAPVHVHGTHLMVKAPSLLRLRYYNCIYTFDFCRRRCSTLSLWDGEGDGTQRRAVFKDGQEFMPEGCEDMNWWDTLGSLGDGTLFRQVSYLSHPGSNGTTG